MSIKKFLLFLSGYAIIGMLLAFVGAFLQLSALTRGLLRGAVTGIWIFFLIKAQKGAGK